MTGFGSDQFSLSSKALYSLEAFFERNNSARKKVDQGNTEGFHRQWPTLKLYNRVLTTRRDAIETEIIEDRATWDPEGALDNLMGTEFVHTEDNVVLYQEYAARFHLPLISSNIC